MESRRTERCVSKWPGASPKGSVRSLQSNPARLRPDISCRVMKARTISHASKGLLWSHGRSSSVAATSTTSPGGELVLQAKQSLADPCRSSYKFHGALGASTDLVMMFYVTKSTSSRWRSSTIDQGHFAKDLKPPYNFTGKSCTPMIPKPKPIITRSQSHNLTIHPQTYTQRTRA